MILLQFIILFKKIFLNFIVKLSFNMLNKQIYNLILIIINCCTQILLYILIIEIIIALMLIEFLKKRMFNYFNYSDRIISD